MRFFFFFKQKTAYEIGQWLEFRRVLFRSLRLDFLNIGCWFCKVYLHCLDPVSSLPYLTGWWWYWFNFVMLANNSSSPEFVVHVHVSMYAFCACFCLFELTGITVLSYRLCNKPKPTTLFSPFYSSKVIKAQRCRMLNTSPPPKKVCIDILCWYSYELLRQSIINMWIILLWHSLWQAFIAIINCLLELLITR